MNKTNPTQTTDQTTNNLKQKNPFLNNPVKLPNDYTFDYLGNILHIKHIKPENLPELTGDLKEKSLDFKIPPEPTS